MFFSLMVVLCLNLQNDVVLKETKKLPLRFEEHLTIQPEDQFYQRIEFTYSETGDYIIYDAGNTRANIYDSNGKFKKSFGRSGSGPGEFSPSVFEVEANEEFIVFLSVSSMCYQVFSTDGQHLFDTKKHFSWKKPVISFQKNEIHFTYNNTPDNKYVSFTYSSTGKRISEKQNPFFKDPNFIDKSKPIEANLKRGEKDNYFVRLSGEYKFYKKNKQLDLVDVYRREFYRLPRLEEKMKLGGNKALTSMRLKYNEKVKNKPQNDIHRLYGVSNNVLILETAKTDKYSVNLDLIEDKNKTYSLMKIEFKDEVRSAKVANDKLLIHLYSDDYGPYLKVFNILKND